MPVFGVSSHSNTFPMTDSLPGGVLDLECEEDAISPSNLKSISSRPKWIIGLIYSIPQTAVMVENMFDV